MEMTCHTELWSKISTDHLHRSDGANDQIESLLPELSQSKSFPGVSFLQKLIIPIFIEDQGYLDEEKQY